MEFRAARFLCLFIVVEVISGESLYYKVPKDHDPVKEIRGNSFGLENFLLQAFKEADSVEANEDVPVKRIRIKEYVRKKEPDHNRGLTYGLENLTPNLYQLAQPQLGPQEFLNDFQPITEPFKPKHRVTEIHRQRINENDGRRERVVIRKLPKQSRRPATEAEIASNAKVHGNNEDGYRKVVRIIDRPHSVEEFRKRKPAVDPNVRQTVEEVTLRQQFEEASVRQPTDQERREPAGELQAPLAEASQPVPKTQEISEADKESDPSTQQRPRKRVTLRRRRKRPQGSLQSTERSTSTTSQPPNEDNETTAAQTNNEDVPSPTTAIPTTAPEIITTTTSTTTPSPETEIPTTTIITTTTTTTTTTTPPPTTTTTTTAAPSSAPAPTSRGRNDQERPSRRRPTSFRRVNQTPKVEDFDQTPEDSFKIESTTSDYRSDFELNEVNAPTTYATYTNGNTEMPYSKLTSPNPSSTEETSATDLKEILKQQNGPLSLSELLQTQNLSLSDFLKNKKEAAQLLSGRRGNHSSAHRTHSREHNRSQASNHGSRGRPFSKNRHDMEGEETRFTESEKLTERTTTEKTVYNTFTPKTPKSRYGHTKGAHSSTRMRYESRNSTRSYNRSEANADSRTESPTTSLGTTTTEIPNHIRDDNNKPKRFNDLRLKFRMHRRKYNTFSTTNRSNKEEKIEVTTLAATTVYISSTQANYDKSTPAEDVSATKRPVIRIPFKSSNNPDLSLIVPSKNKTEDKGEKRERHSNYSSRLHSFKKMNQDKDDLKLKENNKVEQTEVAKTLDKLPEPKLPLDVLDMADEEETYREPPVKKSPTYFPVEVDNSADDKRSDVVGKIPLPNEFQRYDSKDEILELLKPGTNSERLQRILEARNMTVKELLENREKSSLQSNFSQLFNENVTPFRRRNDMKSTMMKKTTATAPSTATTPTTMTTTESADSGFKVFQSLPDFEQIHKNLLQKSVKEHKSNSHPDTQADESNFESPQTRATAAPKEQETRAPKKIHGVIEVKKKLNLNADSEPRDTFVSNDGVELWNIREKPIYFSNPFSIIKEKIIPTTGSSKENFTVQEEVDKELAESDIILLETIKKSQEANQRLKSNINEILQEQTEVKDVKTDIDKSFIPPAVKSAIIASGVVMGLALFVFVAIFVACGWKQRRIRLKARSSILNDVVAKPDSEKKVQRTSGLGPVNFGQTTMYKKTLDSDAESNSSVSASSNASSYLWNTLKNTFAGRNSMLKSRLEKESKITEERLEGLKSALRNSESRRNDLLMEEEGSGERFSSSARRQEERYCSKKSDCLKRSSSFKTTGHYSGCSHGH